MQGVANSKVPVLPVVHLAQVVGTAAMFVVIGAVAGGVVMLVIRWRGWAWTCGMPALVAAPFAAVLGWRGEVCYDACAVATVGGGIWRHLVDLRAGGDLAELARDRVGPMTPIRRWRGWRRLRAGEWVTDEGVAIGFSRRGDLVRVPIAGVRSVMALIVGATGSGKTILMLLLALAAIKRGSGVIFIDPKGDDYLFEQLREAATRAGVQFLPWEPLGDVVYNPFERGSNTEVADKLLAAEVFTEPHYQRLAQRYLGHVIRALRMADVDVSLATVVKHMHPGRLATLTRRMAPFDARPLLEYLETLTPQQERDLAGARDRLAISAESDAGPALDPATGGVQIDLRDSLDRADVVLFRLEADRRPLVAPMVGAAIIQDLVAIEDERQHGDQRPGLVIIDEYSAVGAPQVGRLFGRSRGARLSQVLGTQELGELESIDANAFGGGGSVLNQTAGNLEVLIAGRQNLPDSAEMIAAIAGTRGAWITTQQTHTPAAGLLTGLGSRSRGREYVIHPDTIKGLDVGEVAVIEPRLRRAAVVRVFHPDELRRRGVEC
jgi:TraM recognition site of TraD and TraG/Type IV secretion-system coupling protein DNA-binding domain